MAAETTVDFCYLDSNLYPFAMSAFYQAILSFENNITSADVLKYGKNTSSAFAVYVRTAKDVWLQENNRKESGCRYEENAIFQFETSYLQKKEPSNAATDASNCRHNCLLDDLDGKIKLSELARKTLKDGRISYREYAFVVLAKQWIRVDDEPKKALLPAFFEIVQTDPQFLGYLDSAGPEQNSLNYAQLKIKKESNAYLRNAFLKNIFGTLPEFSRDLSFTRFDLLKNTLLCCHLLCRKDGVLSLDDKSFAVLKDFNECQDSLTKYDFRDKEAWTKYLCAFDNGIFDVLRNTSNIDVYNDLYPNVVRVAGKIVEGNNGMIIGQDVSLRNVQKIYFGAPGTGKSFRVKKEISVSNAYEFTLVNTTFEEHVIDGLKAKFSNENTVENYKNFLFAETNSDLFSRIIGKTCISLKSIYDVDDAVKMYNAFCKGGALSSFNINSVPSSALNFYKEFLNKCYESGALEKKTTQFDGCVFRTTFHPDYDYAQFVGAYKPKKVSDSITYEFVPQVFANAYVAAYKNLSQPVYLVIEEINRGNCAQIFGDIFQLLDRDENGYSRYEIDANVEFAEWLGERKLRLPPNFNILATMNTSDQSLFPMDSAFKRRFDWKYVPIKYEKDAECGEDWNADLFVIDLGLGVNNPKWLDFLEKINSNVYEVSKSEDKQMGEFFVEPDLVMDVDGKKRKVLISLDMFKSKVLFYLWDSVYKDEVDNEEAKKIFHFDYPAENGSLVTFQSLFRKDDKEIIKQMFVNLGVEIKENKES